MGYDFAARWLPAFARTELELVKDLSRELEKRYRLVFEQGEIKIANSFPSPFVSLSPCNDQQYLYDELGAGERRILHGRSPRPSKQYPWIMPAGWPCSSPTIMTKHAIRKRPFPY